MEKISVLGGGSWGTALSILLANKGKNVELWVRNEEQFQEMLSLRKNNRYLPNILLPKNLNIVNNLENTIFEKDIILLAVPTHGVRDILNKIKGYVRSEQIIVNVAKGIENDTLLRVSEIVEEFLPENRFVCLSGPSHAEEVALDIPTTVVSSSTNISTAEYIQDVFMTSNFRVYTNPDLIGVELGGALKNIIALGAGISDGLRYGDNTKAALMTRGISEMARLGKEMGASLDTFWGLSGIGDLIVTCTSMHSRNRRAGILIGEGKTTDEAIKEIGMVVEGIKTIKSAYKLSEKYNIDLPITRELYKVIYENSNVKTSVLNLMGRDKKHEMENLSF
ncbi:NAD(P)H-dependent glycerol-3-phosphate dehydrogenase [Tissierella creatinophila]|uniref:Glycerol-3-phosphate dehydrogenase [NAD(P)+] n=1 Tax=Tissierella creatinophila DSM 6911 TaxID=1123403 RepID=A0A1U7M302_TISCR|nr:NAD(P)H-dependent glycerol-3-phosphate dehydrogenase [Tissierella creatinophila]OLS01687.1 glycerol-3-phosphate dehydrogenase [Tissierella creatinophila DSM 6911]